MSTTCPRTSQSQSFIHMSLQGGLINSINPPQILKKMTTEQNDLQKPRCAHVLLQNKSCSDRRWANLNAGCCTPTLPSCPFSWVPNSNSNYVVTQRSKLKRLICSWAVAAFFTALDYGWLRCSVWFNTESHRGRADPRKRVDIEKRVSLRHSSLSTDLL